MCIKMELNYFPDCPVLIQVMGILNFLYKKGSIYPCRISYYCTQMNQQPLVYLMAKGDFQNLCLKFMIPFAFKMLFGKKVFSETTG